MTTSKMHKNELTITEQLVQSLISSQCPKWSHLSLTPIKSNGTDHALFRLGDDYVVRLPRIEWSQGQIEKNINKEFTWLPQLARYLSIPISEPVFKGNPDKKYPFLWLISKWHQGQHAHFENDNEHEELARDLANFLNELHRIPLTGGPLSRRGIALSTTTLDQETRKAINALNDDIDTPAILDLWGQLSSTPAWHKAPAWVHGDFLPGNIIVNNNRLAAVIDFSDVGIGDPACDLVIAWSLFNAHSRIIFRNQLDHIDDNTWERGRGWALSIALIMLPYYKYTNPVLTALATRMINSVHER